MWLVLERRSFGYSHGQTVWKSVYRGAKGRCVELYRRMKHDGADVLLVREVTGR